MATGMIVDPATRGFVLIELLLVMMMIGILAGFAFPVYHDYTIRARATEAHALWAGIRVRIEDYYSHHGRFPKDNRAAGLPSPRRLRGQWVGAVTVEDGAIHVEFVGVNVSRHHFHGKTLSLRPAVRVDHPMAPLDWICGDYRDDKARPGWSAVGVDRSDLEDKYRVEICR